jgi:hypothetical protein
VPQNTGQVDKGEQQYAVPRVDVHGGPKTTLRDFTSLLSTPQLQSDIELAQ